MRRRILLPALLAFFCSIQARAATPVVVDRDYLHHDLEGLSAQIANLEAQLRSGPGGVGNAVNELRAIQGQLRALARYVHRSPGVPLYQNGPGGPPQPPPVAVPQPPPPVVIAPPPQPQVQPIDEPTLQSAIAAIQRESFEDGRMRVLRDVASRRYFLVAQVRRVLGVFSFESSRLKALEVLAPRILDRENNFQIYDSFTFSSSKSEAEKLLAQ